MDIEQARFNMIEQQIRPWNVLDPEVLQLLSLVRREDFVAPAHRGLAFMDTELPLKGGLGARKLMQPRLEARLLQEARVKPSDRVLEVGTANGYLTALLAHQAAEVISVDNDAALQDEARARLRRLGLTRCELVQGDPLAGHVARGPYDLILLTGSVAELPKALLAQLKPGGRLIGIVGDEPVMRALRVQQSGAGQFASTELFDTHAARLPGAVEPSPFTF